METGYKICVMLRNNEKGHYSINKAVAHADLLSENEWLDHGEPHNKY